MITSYPTKMSKNKKRAVVWLHYVYILYVGFYILEYKKEYNRESLKGTEYEYLLDDDKEWDD
jgi:hypothetical protein